MIGKTMHRLLDKLVSNMTEGSGDALEGDDALLILNAMERNSLCVWIGIALYCLYYGNIKMAKTILSELLAHYKES